jgi:hypothetical protein
MKLLKIWRALKSNGIVINDSKRKLRVVDITEDPRGKLLPKDDFLNKTFQVEKNVHIVRNAFIIRIASWQARRYGRDPNIGGLYFKYKGKEVIIIPSKGYVFFNGKSIEPNRYKVLSVPTNEELQEKINEIEPEMVNYTVTT